MLLVYSRVSTDDQVAQQLDALTCAGRERSFFETASGVAPNRPLLGKLLGHLRDGDIVFVGRLDRLGRSPQQPIEVVQHPDAKGVALRSLTEGIDTANATEDLIFYIFGALAQFERELVRERTQAGLAAARARGRKGGRPRKLSPDRVRMERRLLTDPETTVSDATKTLGVHCSTLHKAPQALVPISGGKPNRRAAAAATS